MKKPANLIEGIMEFLKLVIEDERCPKECRETAQILLNKVEKAEM